MTAAAAPAWAIWLALALGLAACFAWGFVFVQARRAWRQLRPQLAPYLALLGPVGEPSGSSPVAAGTDNDGSPTDAEDGIPPKAPAGIYKDTWGREL